ncbi:hypothetical protein SIN8267_01863 [Sinobacterium norvegicum]|uniref:Uncharacterized protein n=1 Tax=Sinobacterium norvegicum TaxID=1641715 RepID=A0ABM9AF62_9GAMM|nr:M23/M56 family metallopeptidase [Sinobacterium norvegicum]CAH0991749.1 hypothetical protein SIN8267_01863 [Sinobacterium norvegicum]
MWLPILDIYSFQIIDLLKMQLAYSLFLFFPLLLISRFFAKRNPLLVFSLWLLLSLTLILPSSILPLNYYSEYNLRTLFEHWFSLEFSQDNVIRSQQAVENFSAAIFMELPIITWNMLLLLLWLIGSTCVLVMTIKQRGHYYRLVSDRHRDDSRENSSEQNHHLQQSCQRWRQRFSIRRPITVVVGDDNISPFTLGVLTPKIYLSKNIIGQLDKSSIDLIIGHECSHIARFDDLWIQLQNIIQVIFFFYPILWYGHIKLGVYREVLTDKKLFDHAAVDKKAYAEAMLAVLKCSQPQPTAASMTVQQFISHQSAYRIRFHHLNHVAPTAPTQMAIIAGIIATLALFVLPLPPPDSPQPSPLSPAQIAAIIDANNIHFAPPLAKAALSSGYGMRHREQEHGTRAPRQDFHTGVDLVAPLGSTIVAAADGVIEQAQPRYSDGISTSLGSYITIRHSNNSLTFYAPLSAIQVKLGQVVRRGEAIALLDQVPIRSKGVHLHFEILIDGYPIDPEALIKPAGFTAPAK